MAGFDPNIDGAGQGTLSLDAGLSTGLMQILTSPTIQPGSSPSYETCKQIYAYHPLGSKMADAPINLAQSLPRNLSIPGAPEDLLVEAFQKEWKRIGRTGADRIIHNVMKTSRIYGIASLAVGTRGADPKEPLDDWTLHDQDLYFSVLDPLNTAGSLVMEQNPNSPEFLKPQAIRVGAQVYNSARTVVVMNEEPIYIEWTDSAFGFVGRSVYQRAFFPLKSYIQSMVTDDVVTRKAALLVAKLKSPGSMVNAIARVFYAFKREAINAAQTGNVLGIGVDEDVQSLDLKNLKDAAEFARSNILKNIATAANMPASMINLETLAEGFGEGTEDAKQIARYIDGVRLEMNPVYDFMDRIVMHRAWSPEFYQSVQRQFPEYEGKEYKTAFLEWRNAFKAEWPNLLVEPDSELVKRDQGIMESAVKVFEVLAPQMDQMNKANMAGWLADVMNQRKMLVSTPLDIDVDAMAAYTPPVQAEHEPEFTGP
jgi:hypothetical protein